MVIAHDLRDIYALNARVPLLPGLALRHPPTRAGGDRSPESRCTTGPGSISLLQVQWGGDPDLERSGFPDLLHPSSHP